MFETSVVVPLPPPSTATGERDVAERSLARFLPLANRSWQLSRCSDMLCRLSLLAAAGAAALSPKDLVQSIDAADASTCSDNLKFFDEMGLGCKNFGERRV